MKEIIHVNNINVGDINKIIFRCRVNIMFHFSSKETTKFLKYQANVLHPEHLCAAPDTKTLS